MLDTPISDLIENFAKDEDKIALHSFFNALLDARFGIQVERLPDRAVPGEDLETRPEMKSDT